MSVARLDGQRPDQFDWRDPRACREAFRAGVPSPVTVGFAPEFVQANIVILPEEHAYDFLVYCHRNSKACPLLEVSKPGEIGLSSLAADIDIRTDLTAYSVFIDGEAKGDVAQIADLWRDDLVTFALGCSHSFEGALVDAGLRLYHLEHGVDLPCYKTNIQTVAAGRFHGEMVVSMRAFSPADAIRAIQITSRFPGVHGAPIHLSDPTAIGIADLTRPDWGDPAPLKRGEIPLFWACGITPQIAIQRAKIPFSITHSPGHMLITDRRNLDLANL